MKAKRIFATTLAALLLASSLASCSRRDQFRPDETDALTEEQTTVAGQPDVSNPGETNPADTNQSGGDVTESDATAPPDHSIVPPPLVGGVTEKTTGNPYEGWTKEELYASFQQESEHSVYNNEYGFFGNTPYYVILDVQHGDQQRGEQQKALAAHDARHHVAQPSERPAGRVIPFRRSAVHHAKPASFA